MMRDTQGLDKYGKASVIKEKKMAGCQQKKERWSLILNYTGYTPVLYRPQWPNQFVIYVFYLLLFHVIAHYRRHR
jgi:hypothetical protein